MNGSRQLVLRVVTGAMLAGRAALAGTVPPNDLLADALALAGAAGVTAGCNVGAGHEADEPSHDGMTPGGASVWWKWTVPLSGVGTLTTAGSDFDTTLAVYTGGASMGSLALVARDDDSAGNGASSCSFALVGGTTYWIAVDGYNYPDGDGTPETGTIMLRWEYAPFPANDLFQNAVPVHGYAGAAQGVNVGATREPGESAAAGASVWWTWQVPAAGLATISTAGSNFDTVLRFYAGETWQELALVCENDDQDGEKITSRCTARVEKGIYQIAVDGYRADEEVAAGRVVLSWSLLSDTPDIVRNAIGDVSGIRSLRLDFCGWAGCVYRVLCSGTLSEPMWETVQTHTAVSNGVQSVTVVLPAGRETGFYRIEQP